MIRIGITGQTGFIGSYLYNYLGLQNNVERIPFEDSYFDKPDVLNEFVKQCDVIVHLAALNRHNDPNVIYETNILLVNKLIKACEESNSKPQIIFSSSSQEKKDNLYGISKKDGRKLLEAWAKRNNAKFTGLIIPNVFGPFGNPYYNSVVATFCHQLTHNEQPEIHIDGEMKLIYVGELVEEIWSKIKDKSKKIKVEEEIEAYRISHTTEVKVSKVLKILERYKEVYFNKGIIPNLNNSFDRNLFNTFVCSIVHKQFFPVFLTLHGDERGNFVEILRLNSGGQVSFSTTKPGITRGNHFHIRKAERFAVIKGKARIQLRKIGTNRILNFELDGNKPSYVDMPIWYTHNITNIGKEDLYTIFWISEFYAPEDADTYYEDV